MGQLLKVSGRFVIEVWETYVVKHVLAMEMLPVDRTEGVGGRGSRSLMN